MQSTVRLTGHAAIEYAMLSGVSINKYDDPIEDAREGLTVEEAREIASLDASLIWCRTTPVTL